MAQFAESHSFTNVQPLAAQIETKESIVDTSGALENLQPLAAQLQSSSHWTDFSETPLAKIIW